MMRLQTSSRGWVTKVGVCLTMWLFTTNVLAQDLPCGDPDSQHQAPRRAVVEHEGEQGVWFRMDVGKCLLKDVTELNERRYQVRLLEQQLQLRIEQKVLLDEAIKFSEQAKMSAITSLEASERRARKAEERANAWYKHPILWFVVGSLVTTGAVIGAARLTR